MLGQPDIWSPIGGGAAAGGVVLVQVAVADGQGGVRIRIPVDVIDKHLAALAAVVGATAALHPPQREQTLVQLRHLQQVVPAIVGVAGQARQLTSSVQGAGDEFSAQPLRVLAAVRIRPADRRFHVVAAGGRTALHTALQIGWSSTIMRICFSACSTALPRAHTRSTTIRSGARRGSAALDIIGPFGSGKDMKNKIS